MRSTRISLAGMLHPVWRKSSEFNSKMGRVRGTANLTSPVLGLQRDDFGVNQLAVSVRSSLFVQHHTQERSIDLKPTVVLDEAQLAEFVHEKVDA
jgi:hypothetical protein